MTLVYLRSMSHDAVRPPTMQYNNKKLHVTFSKFTTTA